MIGVRVRVRVRVRIRVRYTQICDGDQSKRLGIRLGLGLR
jgi:hypothetical protein